MKKLLMTLVLLLGGIFTIYAQSGYRGFADISLGASTSTYTGFAASFSTTHGYQFNRHFFWGAGVQAGYSGAEGHDKYYNKERVGFCLPLYMQFRYDYSLVSPRSFYAAFRIGYDVVTEAHMPYFAPEFGLRFGMTRSVSFNLGIRCDIDNFNIDILGSHNGNIVVSPMVTFGIEF